jgi:hypothetical protein
MTKVETNVTLLLQGVAGLNGNIGHRIEFKDFLKKLKKSKPRKLWLMFI